MVSEDVFKNTRIYAAKRGQDISAFTEEALREKISQCKELEKIQEEITELRATIDVSRKLYQQISQKPDFNSIISADFIKTITSGIDPRFRDIVVKGIKEADKKKVEEYITSAARMAVAALRSGRKPEEKQEPQEGNERQLLDQGTHFRMFQIVDPEKVLRKTKPGETLVEFELYMPGTAFPLKRSTMLEYAEREFVDRDAFLLNIFQSLNAEEYNTIESLEQALTLLFNSSRKNFFGRNQTVEKFTIYTNEEELPNQKRELDKYLQQEKMSV
jgi:hypothetical protein